MDFTIYTPGSAAGMPINILGSLAAPGLNYDDHTEIIRERINGTVNALLGLVGVSSDGKPLAQPPSKRPMMALLKQSRAVGLGCILATQNPADIDYKGLTNTGTWFIGRLQTERDKARVIEGLKGAIAESGGDSQRVDYNQMIGQLGSRTFLMHNVHADAPIVFQTRWVMCYLHGPLTRPQIRALRAGSHDQDKSAAPERISPPSPGPGPEAMMAESQAPPAGFSSVRQILDPAISELFLPVSVDETGAVVHFLGQAGRTSIAISQVQLVYEPAIIGSARIRFFDRKHSISDQRERLVLAPAPDQFGAVA